MPTREELLDELPQCVAYLAGVEPVSADLLRASPGLRVIARNGVGVDNVDLAAADAAGIEVCPAVGANARAVAELTVGLLFATARHVPWSDRTMKTKTWHRRLGFELNGRTLGIVGLGSIGRIVAGLTTTLGMEVVGYDPYPDPGWTVPAGFQWAELDEVLAEADAVTLHLPPGSQPLVDSRFLALMKHGAVLVNTSRAELVEESAVMAALDSGRLDGYAVDAFTREPPEDWTLPVDDRVIATPHIGGYTAESVERASQAAVEAIVNVLRADVSRAGAEGETGSR